MKTHIVFLIISASLAAYCTPLFGADGPLQYARVKSATYATHARCSINGQSPEHLNQRVADLYRLEYVGPYEEEGIVADEYKLRRLSMRTSKTVQHSPVGTCRWRNKGGELPIFFELFKSKDSSVLLNPSILLRNPFLFPCLSGTENAKQKGDKWTTKIPAFLTSGKLAEEVVLDGKWPAEKLKPVIVSSKWTENKEILGYKCAKIESSFAVNPKKVKVEENGYAEYQVTSYFATGIGLPVATIVKGNGIEVADTGPKTVAKKFKFFSKAILVSYEPID